MVYSREGLVRWKELNDQRRQDPNAVLQLSREESPFVLFEVIQALRKGADLDNMADHLQFQFDESAGKLSNGQKKDALLTHLSKLKEKDAIKRSRLRLSRGRS